MTKYLQFLKNVFNFKRSKANNNQQQPENSTPESSTGSGTDEDTSGEADSMTDSETENNNNATAASDTETEKDTENITLVVYYSASGNTKEAAEYIAAETGGDLFEIVPEEIYTDADLDWTDEDSRVSREHDHEDEREVDLVSTAVDNWSEYDTVFIGYPIWYSDMPQIMYTFFDTYDLSGKEIIPFCTHGGSGLSGTVGRIQNIEPDAQVFKGLAIYRTDVTESDSRVKTWIQAKEK